jgi:hypothetical protein
MTTSIFGATGINGGTDGDMDSIKPAVIADGDICFVVDNTEEFLVYRYNAASTTVESSPRFIRPDDYGIAGVWHMLDLTTDVFTCYGGIIMLDGSSLTWDVTPGTDVTSTGIKETGTAGENLVFGDMCYFKSDGKYWKADADATGTMLVVAMADAAITAEAEGIFLTRGIVRDDSLTLTVGAKIFASCTAGGQTHTAPSGSGDQVQVIGRASHANYFRFEPSYDVLELL